LGALAVAAGADARFGRRQQRGIPSIAPYDGRFTLTRILYGGGGFRGGGETWSHDDPRADEHFSQILKAITFVNATTEATNVLTLDDRSCSRRDLRDDALRRLLSAPASLCV
jgi:hypothetical protein